MVRWAPLLLLCGCLEFPKHLPCETSDDCDDAVCVDGVCLESVATCGFDFSPLDTCGECMGNTCCEASEACAGDPACTSLFDCFAHCSFTPGDLTCLERCEPAAAGSQAAEALLGCMGDGCGDDCGACGMGSHVFAGACGDCFERARPVCDAMSACFRDPGCWDVLACTLTCPDPACGAACFADDPEAANVMGSASFLADVTCGEVCDTGSDWSCVGEYSWGLATVGTLAGVRFGVTSAVPDVVVTDVSGRQCGLLDETCDGPLFRGTDGVLDIPVEITREDGFLGYFEIDGETRDHGPLTTTAVWLGHPLVGLSGTIVGSLPEQQVPVIGALVGVEIDPLDAQVAITARDCKGALAPDVTFSIDEDHDGVFYVEGGPLDTNARGTDHRGLGVFMNVKAPGGVGVFATIRATAEDRPVGEVRVRLTPGTAVSVDLWPASTSTTF